MANDVTLRVNGVMVTVSLSWRSWLPVKATNAVRPIVVSGDRPKLAMLLNSSDKTVKRITEAMKDYIIFSALKAKKLTPKAYSWS